MANDACSFSSVNFKVPSEPCPLPSLGSDEDSFVVLWKDMDNHSPSEEISEPIGSSVIEEAKQLINKELAQIDQLSLTQKSQADLQTEQFSPKSQENSQSEQNIPESEQPVSQMDESTKLPKMEHSTILPKIEQSSILLKMSQVQKGFDTSNVISITTLSTDFTSEEVQKKVSEIIEENIHLKDTILQNNMSMKSQYERTVAWQEDVRKVHEAHKQKIMEAKEFIERLKKENYDLTRDLEKLREIKNLQDDELASLKNSLKDKERQSNEKLIKSSDDNIKEFELDISNKKVKELELAMQNMILENANLKEDKNRLIKDVNKIDQYEKQIEALQEVLHASKLHIEETKMELLKVKSLDEEKQKSLFEVIESLKSQLYYKDQQNKNLPSPEEVENIRQQLTSTQVMLTQVEHTRAAAYAQVAALNNEMLELKKQIGTSQSQQDEMYALQTQLDVYKADFEAERSAKDTIKTENEKLSEDMQNLHRRNQQLQEEIDMIRERDYVVYPPHRERESAASSTSNEHSMKCPKCNFGFKTLQALENHVYRCIELDDHLP